MASSLLVVGVLLIALGVPIYIALGFSALLSLMLFSTIPLEVSVQRIFAGIDKFSLMAIPFFIFAANIMAAGGMADRIVKLANLMVGRTRGGLALTTVMASMFFGAVSGSSPATVASVGKPLFPKLMAQNYPKGFAGGLIVSSGSLGIIIPPSVTMIIYGAVTGVSVGSLFMAGIGAGLLFALVIGVYILWKSRQFDIANETVKPTFQDVWKTIKEASWGLGVPVIILGGIYGGIFTPTEAAGVSVIYALVVTFFIYREANAEKIGEIILDSCKVSAQVMIIIATASIFSWVITTDGVGRDVAHMVSSISSNPMIILLMINLAFLIGGMFLDGSSLIIILAPLLVPIAHNAGIDPVLLGVLITVNCAIGMFTPPFGLNIFVGSTIMNMPIATLSRAAVPFVLLSLITLILLVLVPGIALWLPSVVYP
ncbi:TRAP transporter large permease [Ammoniphilus sp. YIM 78166]|uniref:TRAP transporter large permease n=1 Tax=Ammoniphilus sp. YIM 78166 TaxID=1644106 RepID=UPI0010704C09|nr:TRAP transporter large permease [Ammoniphilus sp. YIM 78166]